MIRELLVAFLVLVAAPFCMGLLPALAMPGEEPAWKRLEKAEKKDHMGKKEQKDRKGWMARLMGREPVSVCPAAVYAAGFLLELAVFQLLAVPVIIAKPWGFPAIVTAYSVMLAVLSLAGVLIGFPVLKGLAQDIHGLVTKGWKKPQAETCIYFLLAAALILFQMYMAYTHAFFDGDDAYYVAQSVITDETNVLYRILPYTGLTTTLDVRHALASLPVWEAYLARVTGIHAAIIAHSVLPLLLIPLTYIVYFRIGQRLFRGQGRKTAAFLIVVGILQIFGNTSIYTNATFFLMRTWQGKSLLCNLVLLVIVWIFLQLWEEKKGVGQSGWWILLAANNIVAAMATTMGAFLAGLLIALTGLVLAIRQKRPAALIPLAASCIPCVVYLAAYVILVS